MVVLTTYGTLAAEFRSREKGASGSKKRGRDEGLLAVSWRRVVLDEAHVIRNRTNQSHKACRALDAQFRWALTGTPLFNSADDVQSLFAFLRLPPVDDYSIWRTRIGRPVSSMGSPQAMALLRVLFQAVCLRRLKSTVNSDLPPITVEEHSLVLGSKQRELYDLLERASRMAFDIALRVGDDFVLSNYAAVLESMLRLRQMCCSASMVTEERLQRARDLIALVDRTSKSSELTKEDAEKLFNKMKSLLSEEDPTECAICLESLEPESARIIRGCMHCFCEACLHNLLSSDTRCPLCRGEFSEKDVVGFSTLSATSNGSAIADEPADKAEEGGDAEVPAKVSALLQLVKALPNDERIVVFSQVSTVCVTVRRRSLTSATASSHRSWTSLRSTWTTRAFRMISWLVPWAIMLARALWRASNKKTEARRPCSSP